MEDEKNLNWTGKKVLVYCKQMFRENGYTCMIHEYDPNGRTVIEPVDPSYSQKGHLLNIATSELVFVARSDYKDPLLMFIDSLDSELEESGANKRLLCIATETYRNLRSRFEIDKKIRR